MCWNQKVDDADSWLPYQQPVRRMSMSWSHTATPLSHPVFKNFSLKVFEQGEKTALRMGENNSKWRHWQRINLKNIQAAHAAQDQKNKRPNQKMGQRTKQTFLQRRLQMANKHTKICATSFIVREMQIKTTMRYHLMLVRMAAIKKPTNNKCGRGCGKKGTLFL